MSETTFLNSPDKELLDEIVETTEDTVSYYLSISEKLVKAYTEDFDEERDCAKKLLAYCREHGYQICGDYFCEEIMEMNVFDSRKRSMYLRLQVPVKMEK